MFNSIISPFKNRKLCLQPDSVWYGIKNNNQTDYYNKVTLVYCPHMISSELELEASFQSGRQVTQETKHLQTS